MFTHVSPLLCEFETGSLQTGFHLLWPETYEEKSDIQAECLRYSIIIIPNTGSLSKPSGSLRQHSWKSQTCFVSVSNVLKPIPPYHCQGNIFTLDVGKCQL